MNRSREALRERAVAMYERGMTASMIATRLRLSPGTAYRWCDPNFAERDRAASRNAKRRKQGACEDCGAPTRYHGHNGLVVSRYCQPCGIARAGMARRGHGPVLTRILAELTSGPRRPGAVAKSLSITDRHARVALLRLMRYGLVVRPKRGLYALAETTEKRMAA